jgi:hypothetical protein
VFAATSEDYVDVDGDLAELPIFLLMLSFNLFATFYATRSTRDPSSSVIVSAPGSAAC